MRLIRTIHRDEVIPRGFGVAWVEWSNGAAVCLPIPLNLLAALLRSAWLWCKRGGRPVADCTPAEAYDAGYRQALEDACEARL